MAANTKPVIDINLNEIFYKLHEVAKTEAEKTDPNLVVENLGVNEDAHSFVGAGEFVIAATVKDEQKPDDLKDIKARSLKAITVYVENFVGKDSIKNVKEDQLVEIIKNRVIESKLDYRKTLVENLFGEAAKVEQVIVGYMLPYDTEIEGARSTPILDGFKRYATAGKGAFGIVAKGIVSGTYSAGKALATIGKGMFGGVLNDLKSLKATTMDGKDINIGQAVANGISTAASAAKDVAKGVKAMTWDVAKDTLAAMGEYFHTPEITALKTALQSQFDKDFPSNNVHVRIYKTNILMSRIQKYGYLDNDVKDKLSNASQSIIPGLKRLSPLNYCLGVEVNAEDANYSEYSPKVIADEFSKAYGRYDKPFFRGKLSDKDVIKLPNWKSRFKQNNPEYKNNIRLGDSIQVENDIMKLLFEDTMVNEAPSSTQTQARVRLDWLKKIGDIITSLTPDDIELVAASVISNSDVSDKHFEDKSGKIKTKKAFFDKFILTPIKNSKSIKSVYMSLNQFSAKDPENYAKIRDAIKAAAYAANLSSTAQGLAEVDTLAEMLKSLPASEMKRVFQEFDKDSSLTDVTVRTPVDITTQERDINSKSDLTSKITEWVNTSGSVKDLKVKLLQYKPENPDAVKLVYQKLIGMIQKDTIKNNTDNQNKTGVDLYLVIRDGIKIKTNDEDMKGKNK